MKVVLGDNLTCCYRQAAVSPYGGLIFSCATVNTDMRFKEWLKEDTTVSGDQYGNDVSPDDNGLVRPQYLTKGVPGSEMATKLFGGDRIGRKFMKKDLRRRNQVSSGQRVRKHESIV